MKSMLRFRTAKSQRWVYRLLNGLAIAGSVLLCSLLLLPRLPGIELLGIVPNWLLIWVVAWSMKRPVWQGMLAGAVLGTIRDSLSAPHSHYPIHLLSLTLVGFLTARLQKQRYIQEDFISVALIVFAMNAIAESIGAVCNFWQGFREWEAVWRDYQRIVLTSSLLSSLWAPVLYYPLNRWWQYIHALEQSGGK
ncbi:MAG: rod shape-determining protein MreD [Chloroflexaceae bacterium]|nr:rod shape-determining protein MreD [Chloroflexaceae bacterium]